MRYVSQATAVAVLSILVASHARAQAVSGLSITNYQFVSEQRWSRTHSYVTYRADLVNTGAARSAVTATVSSTTPSVEVVPGQTNLRFSPVPAGGRVTSLNTFTLFVDRSVTFDFGSLRWSFLAPWASAGPNQTVKIGDTVTLNASQSSNPSGVGSLSYQWAFQSRPFGTAAKLNGADGVIATFVADVPGQYVLLLTVSNGFGTDTATVTISTTNSPPIANAGAGSTVGLGSTVVLNGAASSDVDGDPLTYLWSFISIPTGSAAALSGPTTVSPSFIADKAGTYIVQLVVNDGKVNSAPSTVQISTANTAPVANAGPNQVVTIGAVVQLNGAGSTDVDGDPLTYKWSFNSVPSGSTAAFNNPSAVNPTFTADKPGTYAIQLIVNDGKKDSAPSTVTVTTNTIQAPTANAGPNQTVKHGAVVLLSGTGTDPQALPLTFHWSMTSKPPGSAAVLSSTTQPRPTFTADLPGEYVVQLIVNNGYLNSAPSTLKVTTTNTTPVANAGPDQTVQVGSTVNLTGAASSDADGDPLTYSWSLTTRPTGSTAVLLTPTSATPTFVADLAGTFVAQLIVNDGFTNSPPATVTVTAGVKSITLSPSPLNIPRGSFATLTVTLGAAAGPGGTEVRLASSDGAIVSVPASVLVPQGQTSASVTVTAGAAGTALILATATGFSPASVTVNVTVPSITLAFDANAIGITSVTSATVTLSSPVPSGGLLVNLSALPSGIVTIPPSVTIASGTTGTFQVTGAAVGSTTVTASAPGYNSGSAAITVSNLGAIKLAANVTLGPGQTVPLGVSLATPAPTGGVRINLLSGTPGVATVSANVQIPQGATVPTEGATVTGVGFGTTLITASAPGFQGDSQNVVVTGKLAFSPASLTIGAGGTANLTLTLSAPAPAGTTINLTSDNPSTASVPSSLTFATGATSLTVPVNALAAGTTTIRAKALPHLAETTATVTVAVLGSIVLPSNASVGMGQTVPFPISLSTPAPAGGTTVTLSSGDSTRLTISPTSVNIQAGQTTPTTQPQITGKAPGSVNVVAAAPAFGTTSASVAVTGALNFIPQTITVLAGATQTVSVNLSAPAIAPVVVSLTSDNATIATVPTSVTIPTNGVGANLTVTGVSIGSTKIRATSPGLSAAEATVNVQTAGTINLPSNASVALGGTATLAVTLSQPAASAVTIALASSDATKLTVSPATVTIAAGQTAPTTQPQVTGVAIGAVNVSATASGYTSATQSVRVTATLTFVPPTISITGIAKQNVTIKLSAITPVPLTVSLGSANAGIATVPPSAVIPANSDNTTVQVTAVALGNTTIHAGAAPHVPDATANVSVVSAGAIGLPATASVALGASVPLAVTLPAPAPADVVVSLSSSDAAKVSVTPATVTVLAGATTPTVQPQVTGASLGSATIQATAPGYTAATSTVNVTASLSFSQQNIAVAKGSSVSVNVSLSAVTPVPVSLTLTSDSAAIATITATAVIPANSQSVSVSVTGVAAGTTVVRATGPAGVTPASANVTVGSDINLPAEIMVGPGEQTVLPITLSKPATDIVFLQITTSDATKVSLVQSVVTIQAGQTQPTSPARLNGVEFGTATVTVSAPGFSPASTTVKVGGSLSFSSSTLTLGPSTTHSLGISLSAVAPAGGVLVTLTSSNTAVATLPPSIRIAGGQSGVLVQLTTLAVGQTTLTATADQPTITGATATVTVAAPGSIIIPANFAVGMGESVAYPVSLSAPAPTGGVTVTLNASSANLSFVPLVCFGTPCPPVPSNATHTSVFIGAGQTTPTAQPQIRGVAPATVAIAASASGYANANGVVQVTGSFVFSPNTLNLSPGNTGNLFLVMSGAAPPPPIGLTVTLTSSNPSVAGVQPTVTAFWDGSSPTTLNIAITALTAGTTTIKASAPNMPDATATVTVVGPMSISTTSLPGGIQNRAYTTTLTVVGGKSPFTWAATGLPQGVTLDPATGVISGTPTVPGTSTVNVTVTDSTTPTAQTAAKTLSLVVLPALSIATTSLPGGVVGMPYSTTLALSNGTGPYTWAATGLPGGLTLNPSTGVISGNPTTPGTSSVNLTLTDSTLPVNQTATKTLGITIVAALAITTNSLPGGVVNVVYSAQLNGSGGNTPYTWAATGLPTGLTLNTTTGAISGTPTAPGTSNVSITLTDSTNPTHLTATANLSLTISSGLSITTASLPAAVANAPYSVTPAAAGGLTPYTWSANGLPNGLTINPTTGVISGTPTAAGTGNVTLSVSDSTTPTSQTATKVLSLIVRQPLLITTASLPTGTVGGAYSATLVATGGNVPYSWSASGLPAGLTLDNLTGVISGTPTAAATNNVIVTVNDSSLTPVSKTATLSISIVGPLSVTNTSLPAGIVGLSYSAQLAATGGSTPYTWAASGLPAGLTLNTATGAITGTPTTAGPATVSVTVTDSTNPIHLTATASLPINIAPGISITTTSLKAGVAGTAYNEALAATGGNAPYSWVASGLPAGLSVNPTTGVISGTPSAVGTPTVTITVTDSTNPVHLTATKTLTLAIAPALAISTTSLASGIVGVPYSASLAASGGNPPYTWGATGLPGGLTMNASTGAISGTPTASGTVTVNVTVTDSTNPVVTATKALSLTIAPALSITTAPLLADGVASLAYSATIAATGGTPPYSWAATDLPAGLTINATTGVISGTPAAGGSHSVTVTVTDSTTPTHLTANAQFSLTILAALNITTSALPAGSVNAPYSFNLTAAGARAPYTWSATNLPAGLSINTASGAISGIPTAQFTGNIGVTVTDSSTPTAATFSKNLALTIGPPVPASIVATFGSGQSTVISTQFASQLQVSVRDASNIPLAGATVTFAAPVSGASATFATGGNSATVATTAAGLATSPLLTANGTQGSYNVTATVSGLPPATFSLTNAPPATLGQITVSNVSLGQNLQTTLTAGIPAPAGSGGVQLTLSTSNSSLALLGSNGKDSIQVTIPEGQTQVAVYVQALGNTGSVNITATAAGYQTGTGVVTLTPSAFVLAGPNEVGASFTSFVGVNTTITVYSARLDAAGKYAEKQSLRTSLGASVGILLTSTSAGSITPASVSFNPGDSSTTATFKGLNTGLATVTATQPAGFTLPTDGSHTLNVTILASALIMPTGLIVGRNLQVTGAVTLNGVAPPTGLMMTITSNDPGRLLLSTSPTAAGSASITINLPPNARGTPDFYFQGLASTGTATFTAQASGFGSATETVTLAPSGIVFTNAFGGPPNPILAAAGGSPVNVVLYSARLNTSGDWVETQMMAGGLSATVNITNTMNPTVGAVVPSQVTIAGGAASAVTQFQPNSAGTTVLAVSVPATPAGFATPSSVYRTLSASVTVSKIVLTANEIALGKDLQAEGTLILNQPAPAGGLAVTLTSDSTQLRLADSATGAGANSIVITVPAGNFSAIYYVQALGSSGAATYRATASGYVESTASVELTPSGVVLSSEFGLPFVNIPSGTATVVLSVNMAQLDPATNQYVSTQPLRGGMSLTVTLNTANTGIATVDSPLTLVGGADPASSSTTLRRVGTGTTSVTVTQPPGYTAATNTIFAFKPMPTINVTVQ